jgi:signal transduction histidine kinase
MDATASRAADRAAVRLLPDPAELRLGERALAVSRVLLAIAALVVASLIPSERASLVSGILLLYATFAAILLVGLVGSSHMSPRLPLIVQIVDIAVAATVAFLPISGTVPFFSFLLFPLFTAAARWGFREVMITAGAIEAVILVDALFAPSEPAGVVFARVVAIPTAAAAIGYLAEQQLRRRFEDRALTVILSRARLGGTLADSVNLVLASVRNALRAEHVIVVVQERPHGRALLWRTDPADPDGHSARPIQLPAARVADYWFDARGVAWHAWRRKDAPAGSFKAVALDAEGVRLPPARMTLPDGFLTAHPCLRVVSATLPLSDDWTARLFVLDPAMGVHREQTARFLLRVCQTVGPALYNNYLVRSLRSKAQSLERGRIAREMHDGVTQSLLGLDMEIAVLRRRAKTEAPLLSEDLARVHGIVRDEVVTVRELMEGIRVDDVGSGDFMQHLSGVVDRFSRYTGISARLVTDGKMPPASPHVQRQVARIVYEALVNVRKHSGADRVVIRTQIDGGQWTVAIQDDGRGFPFGGRFTDDELDEKHLGPRTIGERARIIGARLVVDSRPGFGARVELSVPIAAA